MELVQVHLMRPIDAEDVAVALRATVSAAAHRAPRGLLHRRGELDVAVTGPWRPADRWPGTLERAVWTATFTLPTGAWLAAEVEDVIGSAPSFARRHVGATTAEIVAIAFGEGLVLTFSDAGQRAYAAVYRERRLAWSLLYDDRQRVVRCDGQVVVVEAPPRAFPEQDRAGVLLAGLRQWLREPVEAEGEARMFLPDLLAGITDDAAAEPIIRDGTWLRAQGAGASDLAARRRLA
jgi:hypothetical protein